MLLHTAAQHLKREFERAMRPHGLTLLQWRVLKVLSHADGQTQKTLGCELDTSPMSISDVLERLEAAGLVAREVDPEDSRAKRARITAAGQELLGEMRTIAAAVYERAAEGIDEADQEAMMRTLARMVSNLETLASEAKEKA